MADVKKLAEELVNLTVKDVTELAKILKEEYGIGFRKGDQSFHDALMGAFDELKANGKAAEISETWFGHDVTADI